MKIAFIVGGFPFLPETFILNQITGLMDLGHDVEIFALFDPRQPKIHPDIVTYNLLQKVHYVPPIPVSKVKRVFKGMLILGQKRQFRDMFLLIQSLNVFKFSKSALNLATLYRLIPFLERTSFDLLYCHYGHVAQEFLFLATLFNVPYITQFHGYDISAYIRKNKTKIYHKLFRRGDLFLAIGENMRKRLIHTGCSPEKILIHHMGIDPRKFKCLSRKAPQNGSIQILTVGRLVEKKGIVYAIHAVAQTVEKHPNISYTIVGDGPLRADLQTLIAQLGMGNTIQLAGWYDGPEIQKIMATTHIFLLPSITADNGDMEGLPVSLMEAQATGLPVLSTYHSGIPEIVHDGETGFLVPEKDTEALGKRLNYLIEHPELWPELGHNGRKIVEEEFDVIKLNKQLEKIFSQLIQQKR